MIRISESRGRNPSTSPLRRVSRRIAVLGLALLTSLGLGIAVRSSVAAASLSAKGVGAPVVTVTPDGSTQLVFWRAADGHLAEAWYTGSWNGPTEFPQLGTITSAPAVAVTKDGSTQLVFWEGPAGHLFEAWYAGAWNGPLDITSTYLGGHAILGSAPSVVTTKDGSQLVFWRGTDGHLGEAWYSNGWHGPVDFGTLGSLASAPSATVTADGSTQLVFFQGSDNRLTEDWFTGVWNGPMKFGAISSPPSVAVTPDGSTQLVFYKGSTGHLLESWYAGSWNGPVDWTTTAFSGHGLLTSSPSATVTPDGSTQLVFWQGAGSTLWEGWYAGGGWNGPVDWSASGGPPPPNLCGAPANPWNYNFCGVGTIMSPPSNFCSYFSCIPSFWQSTNGYVEECVDGMYSHSGGVSGSCSSHGGNLRPLNPY